MERETDQEQRDRKDEETAASRRARQERLGHVPPSEEVEAEEEKEEKPKRSRARAKTK